MKKIIETSNLLKSIKADDLENIYGEITDKAAEWAIGGYLAYANKLLEDLWAFHSGDLGIVRRQLEGLQIMWQLSGNFPSGIPFPFRKVEGLETENWNELLVGDLYNGQNVSDRLRQWEENILSSSGFRSTTLSVSASILSLQNGLIAEADKFIRYWGTAYMRDDSCIVGYLMRNRKVSAILLQGILSPVFELTEKKCNTEYLALSAALKSRKEKGRSLIYGDQSWMALLKNISLLSIEQFPEEVPANIVLSQWFGTDPASEEDILASEKKIGMSLPADYREFLKASNGFLAHSYTSPGLARVEEIDWLSDLDEDIGSYVAEMIDEEKGKYQRLTKKCLLVSGMYQETQILLFPTHDNDWECWSLTLGGGCGETWFPSFRYYMEDQLFYLECRFSLD